MTHSNIIPHIPCKTAAKSDSMVSASIAVPRGICSSVLPERRAALAPARKSVKALPRQIRCAAASPERPPKRPRPQPGVDTRIHWENEDEGWVGGSDAGSSTKDADSGDLLGEKFADLLNESSDSHYQFLGVSPDADIEEIKAAYRRLSKEYHPDTTSLPLKAASAKFMRLREVYESLSDPESRSFYDWTLAQETASRRAEKMRMRFEDPYEQEIKRYVPNPDVINRLDGRNMALSDQAMSALTIDAMILVFAVACIVYVVIFREPYY